MNFVIDGKNLVRNQKLTGYFNCPKAHDMIMSNSKRIFKDEKEFREFVDTVDQEFGEQKCLLAIVREVKYLKIGCKF